MPPYIGRGASVATGKESTWGTAVSARVAFAIINCDITEKVIKDEANDTSAGGAGVTLRRHELRREVSGTIVTNPSFVALGELLEGALGANLTAGSGPYTHTITSAKPEELPSYTLRVKLGSSDYVKTYSGCKVSKLSCEWTGGQRGKLTATIIAKQMDAFASGSPTSPTALADVLPRYMGVLAWNSVSYGDVPYIRLDVDNMLETRFSVGSAYTQEPMPGGMARKRITVTARMGLTAAQYDTLEGSYTAGTRANATFTFTGTGNNAWAFTVHNAEITDLVGNVQGNAVQEVSVTWAATDDGTGTDGITLVQTNDNSNYYA